MRLVSTRGSVITCGLLVATLCSALGSRIPRLGTETEVCVSECAVRLTEALCRVLIRNEPCRLTPRGDCNHRLSGELKHLKHRYRRGPPAGPFDGNKGNSATQYCRRSSANPSEGKRGNSPGQCEWFMATRGILTFSYWPAFEPHFSARDLEQDCNGRKSTTAVRAS